jgi:hypothetical protein
MPLIPSIIGDVGGLVTGNPAQAAGAVGPVVNAGSSAVSALDSVPKFLAFLGQRQTWIRIAEGTLGLLLILVSVAKLAEGSSVGKAAARAVPGLVVK